MNFQFNVVSAETVQNLEVVAPLAEMDAGLNVRLRHAQGGEVLTARSTGGLWIDRWHWTGRAG